MEKFKKSHRRHEEHPGGAHCVLESTVQTSFELSVNERAAQEYEQAARDEVQVAVAQAAEQSRADLLSRIIILDEEGKGDERDAE